MGKIFSPGKLLLTSEYTVLDGALALAVPTQLGQELFFEEQSDGNSQIVWEAYHENQLWLKAIIDYKHWRILETNLPDAAEFVVKVLKNVQQLSSSKLQSADSYFFKTNLQFPANYGLGSSSTLMNNLAEWSEVDAFQLNKMSLGGSGYDIAVAKSKCAVLYQLNKCLRNVEKIQFSPEFKEDIIFIHLNQKQDSREGIKMYRTKEKSPALIDEFSSITNEVLTCKTLEDFSKLMVLHEQKLSQFLEIPTVKEQLFPDCPSFVKSLGAWGGDFVMSSTFENYKNYFLQRGFATILKWNEMVKEC